MNGKVYVGITNDAAKRCRKHFTGRGSQLVAAATKKYGKDNLVFKVLICASKDYCCQLEQDYIRRFNTQSPHGYNLDSGGSSGLHSAETRAKMSAIQRKRFADPNERAKMREHLVSRLADPDSKAHFLDAQRASRRTPEARKRNSDAVKAYFADPANRAKLSSALQGKPGLRGERCPRHKLTEGQAREILNSPLKGRELAAKFGVCVATISMIRRRINWAHLSE